MKKIATDYTGLHGEEMDKKDVTPNYTNFHEWKTKDIKKNNRKKDSYELA